MSETAESVATILAELPAKYRGPGAAVAVVQHGRLLGEKVWGFADLHRAIPITAATVFPICSITKQMLCGLLTDLEMRPTPALAARGKDINEQLSHHLTELLGHDYVQGTGLNLRALCNNQSGIRDYWALTVLWGARPETPFSIRQHGPKMLERLGRPHFEPGTQYSYANTNFYLVARVIEQATGENLSELLKKRILDPAGMKSAFLCPDTAAHPGPCVGYEGSEQHGHYPAVNRIEWAGDAGIVASLSDMVAYEKFIDENRDNETSWYHHNSRKQFFKDGNPAYYGYGLSWDNVGHVTVVGHGGALRGYRLNRVYAPESRISVLAFLNEESALPGAICNHVLERVLGIKKAERKPVEVSSGWIGTYLDPETQLAITISRGSTDGRLSLGYHRASVTLEVTEANSASSKDIFAKLNENILELSIVKDNRTIRAIRVPKLQRGADVTSLHGDFYCDEIDSTFHCSGTDGMLYGSFDGFLGKGPIHFVRPLGTDVFALACPRSMDSSPPGDWTIVAHRGATGDIHKVTIGCWLARKQEYSRISLSQK